MTAPRELSESEPASEPPPPIYRRTWLVIALVLAVGVGLMGAALVVSRGGDDQEPTAKPTTGTIRGELALDSSGSQGRDGIGEGKYCTGSGGYDDIGEGAQVVITDERGETIALGALDAGGMRVPDMAYPQLHKCVFPFTVTDVPKGRKFYGVEVSRRGVVRYPEGKVFSYLTLELN